MRRVAGWAAVSVLSVLLLHAPDASAQSIRITPSADHVQLLHAGPLELSFETTEDASRLEVTTNVGAIDGLTRIDARHFVAQYVPPPGTSPAVAIVSAAAPELKAFGTCALPLWGEVEARASARPHATVSVSALDGLRRSTIADGEGHVLVNLVVPPGTTTAEIGGVAVPLAVAPASHVLLTALDAGPRADVEGTVSLRVVIVNADGSPRPNAPLQFDTTTGLVQVEGEESPGVLRATWRLPPGPAREEAVFGWLSDEPVFHTGASIHRRAGPAAKVVLQRVPSESAVGGRLELTGAAVDAAGNPADDRLFARVDGGPMQPVHEHADGSFDAALEAPERLVEAVTLSVAREDGTVLASSRVKLRAGAPSTLRLLAPRSAVADGAGKVPLTLEVDDAFGNPADAGLPLLVTSAGAVGTPVRTGPGRYSAQLYVPSQRARSEAVLNASAGELADRRTLALEPPKRQLLVAPKAGVLSNFGDVTSARLGVEVGARRPLFDDELTASLDLAWFGRRAQTSAEAIGTTTAGEADFLSAAFLVGWTHELAPDVQLHLGGGAGLTGAASTVRREGGPVHGYAAVPNLEGLASVGRVFDFGTPFLEMRLERHGTFKLDTLAGSVAALSFSVGCLFDPM